MNYQNIYNKLVEKAKQDQFNIMSSYHEEHHIVPICLGGNDEPENLVNLSARQHFLAHLLLSKIYPNNYKLHLAIVYLSGKHKFNSHQYQVSREIIAQHMKCNNPMKNPITAKKVSDTRKAKHLKRSLSEAEKQNISKRMKEKNPVSKYPWENPRAKSTQHLWKRAQEAYDLWICGNINRYSLARALNTTNNKTTENMIKHFESGWIPNQDLTWLTFAS